MKTIFKNETMEIILNESTNEVHVNALKTRKHNLSGLCTSLRIGVDSKGFDLTSSLSEYIPKSFRGLPGFRITRENR